MDTQTETCVINCRCGESLPVNIPDEGYWSDHESGALSDAGWGEDPYLCPDCYFEVNGQVPDMIFRKEFAREIAEENR